MPRRARALALAAVLAGAAPVACGDPAGPEDIAGEWAGTAAAHEVTFAVARATIEVHRSSGFSGVRTERVPGWRLRGTYRDRATGEAFPIGSEFELNGGVEFGLFSRPPRSTEYSFRGRFAGRSTLRGWLHMYTAPYATAPGVGTEARSDSVALTLRRR